MSLRLFASVSLILIVAACARARTEMTSFVDPAYRGDQRFSSVAVFAAGVALKERQIIENAVKDGLVEHDVNVVRGIDLIPPTRQPSEQEWAKIIIDSGVDTLLIISATEKGVSQAYVPQTYSPGATYGTAQTFGNTTYFNTQQNPGFTTGGYNVSTPRAEYDANLFDVESGQTVWTADASSWGNRRANFGHLGNSVAKKTVQQLIDDGMF